MIFVFPLLITQDHANTFSNALKSLQMESFCFILWSVKVGFCVTPLLVYELLYHNFTSFWTKVGAMINLLFTYLIQLSLAFRLLFVLINFLFLSFTLEFLTTNTSIIHLTFIFRFTQVSVSILQFFIFTLNEFIQVLFFLLKSFSFVPLFLHLWF